MGIGFGRGENVGMNIEMGTPASKVAEQLKETGAVKVPLFFQLYSKLKGYDSQFKYGFYSFNTEAGYETLAQMLINEGAKAESIKVTIPEGRNVWGFANNDAHGLYDVDTAFMDFVLPSYSDDNLRAAMENGHFFAVSRYNAGDRIGTGDAYPTVISIAVNEAEDTITIIGKNTDTIKWVADGVTIQTNTSSNGITISTISLGDHSDEISCYVRAELEGEGGKTLTQAFVCDDGNMDDLINRGAFNPAPIDAISVIRAFLKMLLRTFKSFAV
jgi:hypothetical protein